MFLLFFIFDSFFNTFICRTFTKRTDVGNDMVYKDVTRLANEGIFFLKQRDIFWDQLHHSY